MDLELAKCCSRANGKKLAKCYFSSETSLREIWGGWNGTCNDKSPVYQSTVPVLSHCLAEMKTKTSRKTFFSFIFKAISGLEIALKWAWEVKSRMGRLREGPAGVLGRFVCVQNVLLHILENRWHYIALCLCYFCFKAPAWFVVVGPREDNKWVLWAYEERNFSPPFCYSIK